MADRFGVCEPVARPQPRLQAISNRLLYHPGFGEMLCEQFRLRFYQVRKPCFHDLGDLLM